MPSARASDPVNHAKDSPSIPRIQGTPEFSYQDLRERGIDLAQALSGQLWTDFNHHDPGVTLLEALCFALTENVFAAEAPVADLLTCPDGRIHYHRNGMQDAEDILPCRPTTKADLLRWILDRAPAARNLRIEMLRDADSRPTGLWSMAFREPSGLAGQVRADVLRAYWAARNLGEDLARPPRLLRQRWCRLKLNIAIDGLRSTADILADVLRSCADFINAAPRRCPRDERAELAARGMPADPAAVFEGPVLRNGWIESADLETAPTDRLHFSDLAHHLTDIKGLAGISFLSVEADGLDAEEGSLPWYGPDWALELYWPDRPEELAGWTVSRRGSVIKLDPEALVRRFREDRNVGRAISGVVDADATAAARSRRPAGEPLLGQAYYAAFNHLPAIYREPAPPNRLDPVAQGQFIGYMALLEQWLAHGESQCRHLKDLYTVNANAQQSMWWQILAADSLPGLHQLYGQDGMRRYAQQLASEDKALTRRSLVLDHLLALYGESAELPAIDAYGWYYEAGDWQRHLFECKRQWLLRIVRQTRDRNGGFDYSRSSMGRRGNTPALQERLSMLLGMDRHYSRSLNQSLGAFGIGIEEGRRGGECDVAREGLQLLALRGPLRSRIDKQLSADLRESRVLARLRHYFPETPWDCLSAALLRCATHVEHYWAVSAAPDSVLWLGPDEEGLWWKLPLQPGRSGSPEAPGMYLHELFCRLQRECEGLHLLEHVLLRPLPVAEEADAEQENAELPESFFAHRVSVLLPGWTARGASQSFRGLVRELVTEHAPAHLLTNVLWLDCAQVSLFERVCGDWLEARQLHCESLCRGDSGAQELAARNLNRCSRVLGNWLQARLGVDGGGA